MSDNYPFVYKGKEIGFGYTCSCGRIRGRFQGCDHGRSEKRKKVAPEPLEPYTGPKNIRDVYSKAGEKYE